MVQTDVWLFFSQQGTGTILFNHSITYQIQSTGMVIAKVIGIPIDDVSDRLKDMQKFIFLLCLMGICFTTFANATSPTVTVPLASQIVLSPSIAEPAIASSLDGIDVKYSAEQLIEAAEIDEDVLPLTVFNAIIPTLTQLMLCRVTSPPYSLVIASLDRPPQRLL